jgi:hypothetical protein
MGDRLAQRPGRGAGRIALALALLSGLAAAQAVKGRVTAQDPPPPLTYHGLVPGLSTADEVRRALGPPEHEARWYAYKLLYPAAARAGLLDAVYLHGPTGGFANAEVASIPPGYATEAEILKAFGEPEYVLRMATFSLLDYSIRGVRFTVDRGGRTNGVAYFPHLRPRVHSGARRLVDLRALRQGPQPRPRKPAPLGGLRAGTSEVDISPVEAAWLAPQLRDRFRPHDPLRARILVLEHEGRRIGLVGADLFGMQGADIAPIRARSAERGVEDVVVAMSHDHAAPDTIGVYGFYPERYIAHIQDRIVQGIANAAARLEPVKELRSASRELPMDGARVTGLFRNARNPGVLDPTLSLLLVLGAAGRPIATVVNFACHVEGLEAGARELSADFPGYMCDRIRQDGGGQAIFLNGAVGGMVSGDSRARTHEEAARTGVALAGLVAELAHAAQPPATFAFSVERRAVEIPMTTPKFKPMYESGRTRLYRGRVRTEMMYLRLGEAQILTIPGELLPEVSFEILERMTGFPRILVGLANDEIGYIIPAEDFRDDEYEETMSQGPAAAPLIKETAIRLLTGVR